VTCNACYHKMEGTYVCNVACQKHNNNMFHMVIIFVDTHQRCGTLIVDSYFPSSRHDGIEQKIIIEYTYISMKHNEWHVENQNYK
jgi:hypothetical protein